MELGLAGNWLQTGLTGGASDGDFNGDGNADAIDASIMAANWGAGEASAVPEPGTLVLLLSMIGSVLLVFYRKKE